MSLLLAMFPVYILGNLHCIGMCGPLVMLLGRHRCRFYYFFGRLLSFSLAGMIAGGLGAVLHLFLAVYHVPALASFLFGGMIFFMGLVSLFHWQIPGGKQLGKLIAPLSQLSTLLLLKDRPWPTFLFGFFTVLLPCGQTVFVFSACALSGSALTGLINGFAFALLTTPSLLLALHAHGWLGKMKKHYNTILGCCALIVGTLAVCRGCAEVEWIPHWVLNPHSDPSYHIVIY